MQKTIAYAAAIALVAASGALLSPSPAQAAHAGEPYTNVDHSNDLGNDTGDSRVDGLNSSQLNENYQGPLELRSPANNPSVAMAPQSGEPRSVPAELAPR
jgi:hypothetical protein